MGQTIRNSAHYDRLFVPGASGDKRKAASKIEYLEDRRRAKIVPFRNDTLQYDFNFTRATGALSDKLQRIRYIEERSARGVERPDGIGGRRRAPEKRRGGDQRRSRPAPSGQNQKAPVRGKQGPAKTSVPGQKQKPARANPAPAKPRPAQGKQQRPAKTQPAPQRQRPAGTPVSGQKQRPAKAQPAPQRQRPTGTPVSGQKQRPAKAQAPGAKQKPAGAQAPKAKQKPAKGSRRPQRETVTDFRTVGPQGKEPRPRSAGNKNGHGRKLTPTYDLKGKVLRGEWQGAPVIEGGVVGFDMVDNSNDRPAESPAKRKLKARSLVSTMLTIAIVFVLLCAAVSLNAQVSNYSQQNASIEKNIGDLEEEISKLKMEIALQEDLGNIQERATALGMAHPEDSQVEFVDLSATDVVDEGAILKSDIHSAASAAQSEPSFLETVGAWLASIFGPAVETATSAQPPAATASGAVNG